MLFDVYYDFKFVKVWAFSKHAHHLWIWNTYQLEYNKMNTLINWNQINKFI